MFDFTKFCASNNDFILIDHRKPFIADAAKLAITMCRRRYSVGADGASVSAGIGQAVT